MSSRHRVIFEMTQPSAQSTSQRERTPMTKRAMKVSMTMRGIWGAVAGLSSVLLVASALAQSPVVTQPQGFTSLNVSGTIAVTNTFQSVVAAGTTTLGGAGTRRGCLIQNNGTATMWVFVGPPASATKATSFTLVAPASGVQGGSFSCATGGGGVVQDQISITGTANDAFSGTWQ